MPYMSIVDGIPTLVDDYAPVSFAPPAPSSAIVERPDEAINLIVREISYDEEPAIIYDDIEESESEEEQSESEGEEPQYGTWQPDTSCFVPENKPVPESEPVRPNDLDLWRVGLRNEHADLVIQYHRERLEKCDESVRSTAYEIVSDFFVWKDSKERKLFEGGIHYAPLLLAFLEPRYKNRNGKLFYGVRVTLTDDERERKEALERAKREKEEMTARDLEERLTAQEQFAQPPDTSSDEEEKTKNKKEAKDTIEWNGKIIHRHPEYPRYGGDLITGEIYKLKGNKVVRLMNCSLEKGVVLECPKDEDGKRVQKYKSAQIFTAEAGRLKQETKFHTKLKINTESQVFKTRPFVRFYPIACLSYEYDGGVDFNGDIHHIKSGNALVNRCKKSKEINDYIAGVKDAFEDKLKKYKDENAKLKYEIALLNSRLLHLEKQNAKLNTPLTAGVHQLQELLMTKVGESDSTVMEMLQFCFKDINRNYPKEADIYDPEDDGQNFIFPMSPRGLPYDCEHLTRQEC